MDDHMLDDGGFPSENEAENKYFKKYVAILRRCKSIQKENEMLVHRVYQVKKIVRRLRKERKFLMDELDKKGDNFRSLPLTIAIEEEDKSFALPQTSSLPALGRPRSSGSSASSKRQANIKREKTERDPTAPKRPSNAFLQFCQEQRDATTAQYLQTGRPLDKKQLTKVLAARWNVLPEDEKKKGSWSTQLFSFPRYFSMLLVTKLHLKNRQTDLSQHMLINCIGPILGNAVNRLEFKWKVHP